MSTTNPTASPTQTPTRPRPEPRPVEELKALAEAGARELAGDPAGGVPEANPADVIRWVSRNFDTAACAVACSMADAALPHYVAQYQPGVDVLFLDTGYHFRETYDTRNEVARRVDVHIVDVLPEQTVEEQVTDHLQDCMKSKTLMPAGCVFGYDTDNEIIGDVAWSLERSPQIGLTSSGNDLELTPSTVEVRVQGRYRDIVTAAEHDFDEKLSFVLGGSVVVKSSQVSFEPRRLGDVTIA